LTEKVEKDWRFVFSRGLEVLQESCVSGYPLTLEPRIFLHQKKKEDVPFDPDTAVRPPVDLDIHYEWYGDSCVMHHRPRASTECAAHAPPNLYGPRHYENSYKWVPVLPDARTEQNGRSHLSLRRYAGEKECDWIKDALARGARVVDADSDFPPMEYLARLCRDSGYSLVAAIAAVAVSTSQFTVDRRSSALSEDEDWDGYSPRGGSHKFIDPNSLYIAPAPGRQTLTGGGFTTKQVTREMQNHKWSLAMQGGVFDVVVRRRSPKEVAAERRLNYQTLKNNSRIIRRKIRG
jgi:hypothetical protein